jgi:hypothetical protein
MSHRILVTSLGTVVDHWHKDDVYGEISDADKATMQANALATYPGITPVEYIHLDHTSEVLLPSYKWNCWGFTFNPRQCWVGLDGSDIQLILDDNGTQVFVPNLRIGDVICYRNAGTITHTGRIWSLDAAGNPALVQSKWGSLGEYFHAPATVPASYGADRTYWRVTPLGGKGDAWVKDCAADDRLPYAPCSEFYLSPDLWCNNSGGATHEDPHRGSPNQLWVKVRNADTLAITNAEVRVYWANPTGGMPHTEWALIGTALVSVPAGVGNEATAGPVMWTPGAAEPEHCCLFAIVNTGEDYHEPTTLDPIVWPFDIARDNNIIWKNMWIEEVPAPPPPGAPTAPGGNQGKTLTFVAKNPFNTAAIVEVKVKVRPITGEDVLRMGFAAQALTRAGGPVLKDLEVKPVKPGEVVAARHVLFPTSAAKVSRLLGPKLKPKVAIDFLKMETTWRKRGGALHEKGLVFSLGRVAPGKGGRIDFRVAALPGAKPGDIHRIDFEQTVGGQVTGGGAYVIVVKG